jgi:2-isopropylmalate synthase
VEFVGEGNGPVEAAVAAIGVPIRVQGFEERSMGEGADAAAMASSRWPWMACGGQPLRRRHAPQHGDGVGAAIISAANRAGVHVVPVAAEDAVGCTA